MAATVPLMLEVGLRPDFTARLRVPLDMDAKEAHRLATTLFCHALDPSSAAKFAASDPSILPSITE